MVEVVAIPGRDASPGWEQARLVSAVECALQRPHYGPALLIGAQNGFLPSCLRTWTNRLDRHSPGHLPEVDDVLGHALIVLVDVAAELDETTRLELYTRIARHADAGAELIAVHQRERRGELSADDAQLEITASMLSAGWSPIVFHRHPGFVLDALVR